MNSRETIALHPEFISRNGEKEFVVLPYEEFVALQELLEDAYDLFDLREAKKKEKDSPTISFEDVKKELGI
ncbi:MAG: type II toxin-antitoxin system Phd/YefM family antitoxin [Planctomycetes bacterium]|nr:type II toxin-antitoxin system Phd/YefM family antitoxin [Planctomycetota bacterium]